MKIYDIHAPTPQGSASKDQQAFLMGVSFHEAALRCGVSVKDPLGAPVMALCPMIVSYAFAAELYLKSLANFGTGRAAIRGHKLGVLFGRLADSTKEEIATAYAERTGRNRQTLEADLRRLSDAFVEWRYIYEADGRQLYVNLLIAFALAIYETVRRLQPNWGGSDYEDERIRAGEEFPTMTVVNLGGGVFIHMVDGTGSPKTAEILVRVDAARTFVVKTATVRI